MGMNDVILGEAVLLSKDIANEDDLGAVIRGHIRIENILSRYISAVVKNPEKIEGRRFEYSAKVDICLALGLRSELQGPLIKLGKIRNDFAHKTDRSIAEEDCNALISSFCASDKKVCDGGLDNFETNGPKEKSSMTDKDRFRMAMVTLWAGCRYELSKVEGLTSS